VFAKKKSEMVKFVEQIVTEAKLASHQVERLRTDGAGKNHKTLHKLSLTWDKDKIVAWESTAPSMPQWNGVVKQKIALLRDWAHAQFLAAGWKTEIMNSLWADAVTKMNVVANVACTSLTKICAHKALKKGKKPQILPYLIQLGRIGVVTICKSIKGKWKERGKNKL
jgi:hypothetical protein